jgi:hypothetical protein
MTYLNHHTPNLLPALPHTDSHIAQHRRVSNVRSVGIAVDVGSPFEFRRVRMAGSYITGLQLLKLLLGAEFIGLYIRVSLS